MTPLSELQVREGEIKIRLSELAGETELTDEHRSELDSLRREYGDTERKITALRISDAPKVVIENRSNEGREYRHLAARGNVGEIFHAALHGGVTTGATAELQKHHGLGSPQRTAGHVGHPLADRPGT